MMGSSLELFNHRPGYGNELTTRSPLETPSSQDPRPQAHLLLVLSAALDSVYSILPRVLCWNTK